MQKKGEIIVHFDRKTLRNIFIGVAACIVLYWILHEPERFKSVYDTLSGIFSPFVVGAGLAFIINVPMRSIENRLIGVKNENVRRVLAVLGTLAVILLVLALVFYLLIPQVIETAETVALKLPDFFNNLWLKFMAFLQERPELLEWFMTNTSLESFNIGAILEKVLNVVGNSVSTIVTGAFTAIGGLAGILVNGVIAIIFALYCLFNKETLARQGRRLLYAFVPEKASDQVVRILRLTNSTFSNFLSGQCLEVCILGCLFAVTMAILRLPYIPLVSVLVAVTAFIPVVGAFAGCILGAFFILVNDPIQAVIFIVMFLVLQQIENNLIYPRVVGTSIGLPGMWVLLAVAVGGELMGVAGMFLMIPLASVLYTLLRELTNSRLETKQVVQEKLLPQPPELYSHRKERRKHTWNKWLKKLNIKKK